MYNDLFTIGGFTLHTYGLMTAIGIIAAYFSCEYRAKKHGLQADRIFLLVVFCLIFGYAGSKLLYIITILPDIIKDPSLLGYAIGLGGGWVVWGAKGDKGDPGDASAVFAGQTFNLETMDDLYSAMESVVKAMGGTIA